MMDSQDEDSVKLERNMLVGTYEELNRIYRTAQKDLERDTVRGHECLDKMADLLKDDKVTIGRLNSTFAEIEQRTATFKEKIVASISAQKEIVVGLKQKLAYLADSSSVEEETSQRAFHETRLNRIIIDYMLRSGYYRVAAKLAEKYNIVHLTNLALFADAEEIENSLKAHQTKLCLQWCHTHRSKLRRLKSNFELKLRQQNFIEMLRKGERMNAVLYARMHFSKLDAESFNMILPSMALFAIDQRTVISRYRPLWSEHRWLELIQEFREEILQVHGLSQVSQFSAILQCGISALKTPHCGEEELLPNKDTNRVVYSDDDGGDDSFPRQMFKKKKKNLNDDCPVCNKDVLPLAVGLPMARVNHSKVRCAYTGKLLDENNIPLCLPNGMVYSEEAILSIAYKNNSVIICPRTRQQFDLEEAERVYIM